MKSWGIFPSSQHFGGRMACWSSGMEIKMNDKWVNYSQKFAQIYTNHTTSWLVHSWNILSTWMNHRQTRIHKIDHNWTWGKPPPSPYNIFFVPSHKVSTQMSFCLWTPKLGVLKFSNLKFMQLWKPITLCADLRLKWGMKQSCSPHRQWYVAHHLHTRKLGKFSTFSGWESNWQFDFWPFFWP